VNYFLGLVGIHHVYWEAGRFSSWIALSVMVTWRWTGYNALIYLAAMQSIPEELYEAAAIDGAGFWKTQWSITLPLLGPTIRIWAFLSIIGSLQLFDLVNIIWGQYISATAGTSTMATYMYQNGHLAGNYGYGNAVAVMLFLISLVVALVYQRFVLRRDTEGALTGDSGKARRR
jgi:multiple sugar transport system permease protein/raffinose/stachyose/melibiose transport system permease protein